MGSQYQPSKFPSHQSIRDDPGYAPAASDLNRFESSSRRGDTPVPDTNSAAGGYNGPHDDYGRTISMGREPRLSLGSGMSRAMSQIDSFTRDNLLGSRRPRPHKIWRKKFVKLLVVGDSGLGKTTLIKAIMSTPGERIQVHDGSYTPTEQFRKDPDSLCSTISWRDEEDRVIWIYKIQDTPGYGDDLNSFNNLQLVMEYIESQNKKWLDMETSRNRKEDMGEMEDPRVDLCLFCIPPHRIRPLDLKYMADISQSVPVVPIVTKADTMTIREATLYRQEVATKISNPMVPCIKEKINVFKFERDTLERSGVTDSTTGAVPFLVIASNDINEELQLNDPPVYWPERRYPWGTAEAFNREHSDLLALRALLLKEAIEEISRIKRQRYEDWRRKQLANSKVSVGIRKVLISTLIPALLALQLGRSGLHPKDIPKAIRDKAQAIKDKILPKQEVVVMYTPAPPAPPPAAPPATQKRGW